MKLILWNIFQVHIPFDVSKGLQSKGIGFVEFCDKDISVKAMNALDGQIFQGRLLHILPAAANLFSNQNNTSKDKFSHSRYKDEKEKQKRQKIKDESSSVWNALFMRVSRSPSIFPIMILIFT